MKKFEVSARNWLLVIFTGACLTVGLAGCHGNSPSSEAHSRTRGHVHAHAHAHEYEHEHSELASLQRLDEGLASRSSLVFQGHLNGSKNPCFLYIVRSEGEIDQLSAFRVFAQSSLSKSEEIELGFDQGGPSAGRVLRSVSPELLSRLEVAFPAKADELSQATDFQVVPNHGCCHDILRCSDLQLIRRDGFEI